MYSRFISTKVKWRDARDTARIAMDQNCHGTDSRPCEHGQGYFLESDFQPPG